MKVVQGCHMHDEKLSNWCSYCKDKQIEDCKTCHWKRIEQISEILSSKGHTRTEYLNALKAVMSTVHCEDCASASGFDPDQDAWPYNEAEMTKFEKYVSQRE